MTAPSTTFYGSTVITLEFATKRSRRRCHVRRRLLCIPVGKERRNSPYQMPRIHRALLSSHFTDLRSLRLSAGLSASADMELIKFRSFRETRSPKKQLNEAVRGMKHILMSYFLPLPEPSTPIMYVLGV